MRESDQVVGVRLNVTSDSTEAIGESGLAAGQEDSTRFYRFVFWFDLSVVMVLYSIRIFLH